MTTVAASPRAEYTGNGETLSFTFNFYLTANTEVEVYVDGVLKTLTTHYSVSGAFPGASHSIVFVSAPTGSVVIQRSTPVTQAVDLTNSGGTFMSVFETAMDKMTRIIQDIRSQISLFTSLSGFGGTGMVRKTGASFWSVGTQVATSEVADDAVTNAKLANMAANTIKGAVSSGDPVDLTPAQVRDQILSVYAKSVVDALIAAAIAGIASFTANAAPYLIPENYGAVGDGVADDTAAIQTAFNAASVFKWPVIATQRYRITATVELNSNLAVMGFGTGEFIKDFESALPNADAMFRNINYADFDPEATTFTPNISNVTFSHVRLSNVATRSGSLIDINAIAGLTLDNVTAEKDSPGQGNTIRVIGENIEIISPTIKTMNGLGDGLHFGYVKNLTITSPNIDTQDDCIAFTSDPTSFASAGPPLPSEWITIIGGTLRSDRANAIRISNGYNNVDPNAVGPNDCFSRVRVIGCVFERNTDTGAFVNLRDQRSNGNLKHDDIVFEACLFKGGEPDTQFAVWLQGNNDPANPANAAIKNFGRLAFINCDFEQGVGEFFGGGNGVSGGFEELAILGGRMKRLAATTVDHCVSARQFKLLKMGGGLLIMDNCSGTGGIVAKDFDRIDIGDVDYVNDHASGNATGALRLGTPNANAVVICTGLRARGDCDARITSLSTTHLGRLEVSGGLVETLAGDVASAVTADVMIGCGVTVDANGRTIAVNESGAWYSNEGATALAVFNLPAAARGLKFGFTVQDADGIRVVAASGDTIRIGADVSAAGGRIDSTTIGATVQLKAINATKWIALMHEPTWTVT